MLLFWWYSEAAKQYGHGRIVAVGATVDEARINAMTGFEPWVRYHHEWLLISPDQDDKDELAVLRAKFDADIAKDPEASGLAVIINGSE